MATDKDMINSGKLFTMETFSRNASFELTTAGGSETSSRQCSEIDAMVDKAVLEGVAVDTLRKIAAECSFCVTIADPRQVDFPLIAVSDQFEAVTGYCRHEILGKNCRFLNQGCELEPYNVASLRHACATGAPFSGILTNRKKSGQLFMNLLDLRGLALAQNPSTGEKLWFLVGIQADVSNVVESELPENHLPKFHQLADAIRMRLTKELSIMALSEAIACQQEILTSLNTWVFLAEPCWHACSQAANGVDANEAANGVDASRDDEHLGLKSESKSNVDDKLIVSIVGGLVALLATCSLYKVLRSSR